MRITWSRVLIGVGVLVFLLGIGTLEVLSQRVRVDPAATALRAAGGAPEPSWDSLAPRDDLLSLEADRATDSEAATPGVEGARQGASPVGRLTVLEVNQKDRRLSLNARGRILAAEVSNEAVVIMEDRKAADLGLVKPGDIVSVEASEGQIHKIVVLRPAWQEITSQER
ncbi:MAG TPA: hypothetical protein VFS98_14105 [Methylomirabilota bacterium]|nr:hypothetical protein [Methylomirabilota bacterium]